MAKISVGNAFVEERLEGNSGVWGLKVSEPHSRKTESGDWETTSRTFFTVKASRDSGIQLSDFVKGDRVSLTGSQKTEVSETNGKKYYNLTVWVDEIQKLEGNRRAQPVQGTGWNAPQANSDWGAAMQQQEVPF